MVKRDSVTLPYDILCIVANFLDSHHDLYSLCLVSRDAHIAALPALYRNVIISTESLNSQGPWLTTRFNRLVNILSDDLQFCPDKGRARYIRSLSYVRENSQTPTVYRQRRVGRSFGLYSMGASNLIQHLPNLERLEIVPDFAQAVGNIYIDSIRDSSIKDLLINNTCQYDRLEPTHAHDTSWEAIQSPNITRLAIHNIAPAEKRDLTRLRSRSVPACASVWNLIANCPNIKHLDLRLRMDSTQGRYDYLLDTAYRQGVRASDHANSSILVRLESLRLQNLTFDAVEFNRLSPLTLKTFYLPLGGWKRFFRDLINPVKTMIFPKNVTSLALDCLPLYHDRRERWLDIFDTEFCHLRLEELFVLTYKRDFFIESSRDVRMDISSARMPSTKGPALKLTTEVGSHLKRILLKGSWELNIADLTKLLESCYNLEELGIALHWKSWDHDKDVFTPSIKRLTNLYAVHILNEPRTDNMNSSFGAPLPTKNKIWGSTLSMDQTFMQFGAPQERLKYFGIGKKMWKAFLEDPPDPAESNKLRRVLKEINREEVKGVRILEWIRFCDECWI